MKRRVIRTQADRDWLWGEMSKRPYNPIESIGDVKRELNVDCAAMDIIMGWEVAMKDRKDNE